MADHIQIGDIAPRIQYAANGAQTQFTYPFPIFVAADLEVYLGAALQTTGYTVAGAGASAGGTVTFAAAPTNGTVVTLRRNIAIKRTSDFQESGEFRAKVINDELDYQTAALQQVADDGTRSLQLAATDTAANLTLPVKAARASQYLGFDANGDPVALAAPANTTAVSAYMATVLGAADAPAARATQGLVIGTNVLAPNGDGSALTNLPLDATLASDIRLIALETAALKGDRLNMANGWADPLKDETDIETGSNVAATFVSTGGGYYHNPETPPATDYANAGGTGNRTASITITNNGSGWHANPYAPDSDLVDAGTVAAGSIVANGSAVSGMYARFDFGAGAAKYITEFKEYWINAATEPTTFKWQGSNNATDWTDMSGAITWGSASSPSTVAVTGSNYGPWRYVQKIGVSGTGNAGAGLTEVDFKIGTTAGAAPPAMTVVSKQVVAASAAPTVGRLHVQIKDITGGSSVNTDFKGYVSRDNGTTYTQGTLALVQTLADATVAYEFDNLSISGQPSGTAPRFKFTTHNSKQIQLHGVVVQWK